MEEALRIAFENIKKAVAFLEKVKVKDKKDKREKEDMIAILAGFMKKYEHMVIRNDNQGDGDGDDVYDDVSHNAASQQENYDDVVVGKSKIEDDGELYADTAAEDPAPDIYDDTVAAPGDQAFPVPPPVASTPATINPTACSDLINVTTADFLEVKREERSLLKNNWLKRWCVIQGNILYMYDSSSDKKQKDAFVLTGCSIAVTDSITRETKRKERCFQVVLAQTNKSYDFCASDKESVMKWKQFMEQATPMTFTPKSSLTMPEPPPAPSVSPAKKLKKINLFSGFKKTKNVPENVTTTSQTDDDNAIYDDTVEPSQDDDIYDSVENDPKSQNPAAQVPLPTPSFGNRSLPPAPEEIRSLPPPPESDSFPGHGVPQTPTRPGKAKNNPSLPPLPQRDTESDSGSGSFSSQKSLPPPPIPNQTLLPPPPSNLPAIPSRDELSFSSQQPLPPPAVDDNVNGFEDDLDGEEEFRDTDSSELYQGMWDCHADESNELAFKRGQIVHIISKEYDKYGWWIGKRREKIGFVPRDYLMEAYEM